MVNTRLLRKVVTVLHLRLQLYSSHIILVCFHIILVATLGMLFTLVYLQQLVV